MSLLKVLVYPDPALREPAREVERFDPELENFIRDLWETMLAYDGVGLAATQVGRNLRACVISWKEHRLILVNPRITAAEGEQVGEEGCLSFPGIFEKIRRPLKVRVEAVDAAGKPFSLEAEGFLARALCHEIDHLDGRLLIDHLSPLKREIVRKKLLKRSREERRNS
ncbi:MAG: peptide deformylase [Synergistaceae bacterium]|jgi:peptide deformylase|nr:peptide deformylase [Synergistaceae bacterium]